MKLRFLWLLLFTGAIFSCKKKEGNITIAGQTNGAQFQLFYSDTFTIEASSLLEDSVIGNNLPYSLIGAMSDPLLGKTSASAYASLQLLESKENFPNTEDPDSAVLFIPIIDGLNFYGNRLTTQQLNIYPVTSDILDSKVYYQTDAPAVNKNISSKYTGPIFNAKYDSIRYLNQKIEVHPGLRIKLSKEMADMFMHLPQDAYKSNENLEKYLKGLAIIPEDLDLPPGKGGIGVFDLDGASTLEYRAKVLLYYQDTQTFSFVFAGSTRTITTGKTGPFPSNIIAELNNPNNKYSKTYVQSLSGIKTRIKIPYLFELLKGKENNIAINKAELTFYDDKTKNDDNFFVPPRLNLFKPLTIQSHRNSLLPDAFYNAASDGVYRQNSGNYKFIITRYIQSIIDAKFKSGMDINYGLFLSMPSAKPVLAARTAIDHTKTKLIIVYTKLN